MKPSDSNDPVGRRFDTGEVDKVVAAVRDFKDPSRIGPYQIEGLIGEGGMGTVYRARQLEPIERTVALKVVKLGMDTRQVIARFESERQTLALLEHANVARVLDAGATEAGRPYFVMEYVQGQPITAFADAAQMTLRQRLELFIQACDGVQHAHQKAIIHRDLKPSNILVTYQDGKPLVKVIDFGVAKAIQQGDAERTLFTEAGQLVGTPEYMSPEQAEPTTAATDTRADVYSLGIVLYELLAGALPFEPASLRSAGYAEIQRIIRDVEPPRPSTRLTSLGDRAAEIAQLRRAPLEELHKQLRRELEWIPLKAIRKDREQRYATASELAQDIQNYLADRPLRAGPESAAYRARKFLRRNKIGVAASAAMVLLLIGGIAATTWQAIRATRAEHSQRIALKKAEDANANTQAVNKFLTDDLLASASPGVTRGKEMTVREALDRAADAVTERFGDRPLTEASIRSVLAGTYDALGLTERGLKHAHEAMRIQQREHGPDHEETLIAVNDVARSLAKLNRHAEAEPIARDAVQRSQRTLGEDHPVTLSCIGALAMTLRLQERFAEAEPLYRRLLETNRRVYGAQSDQTASALNSLAVLLNTQGRSAEA
ncbi:MAG: protein kinase domain-containing protein, partial [Tepidisphaeraceae bacterium]